MNATAIQIRLLLMDVASSWVNWGFGVPKHSMGNTCRCSERENPAIRDGKTTPRHAGAASASRGSKEGGATPRQPLCSHKGYAGLATLAWLKPALRKPPKRLSEHRPEQRAKGLSLARQIGRPVGHQPTPPLEQVGAPVRGSTLFWTMCASTASTTSQGMVRLLPGPPLSDRTYAVGEAGAPPVGERLPVAAGEDQRTGSVRPASVPRRGSPCGGGIRGTLVLLLRLHAPGRVTRPPPDRSPLARDPRPRRRDRELWSTRVSGVGPLPLPHHEQPAHGRKR